MEDKAYKSVDEITPHIMVSITQAEYEKLFGVPYHMMANVSFNYIGAWMTKNDFHRGIKRWETLEHPNPSEHEDRQTLIAEYKEAIEVQDIREDLREEMELGERVSEKLRKEKADLKKKASDDAQLALAELYEAQSKYKEVCNERDGYSNRLKKLKVLADERIKQINNLNPLQCIMRKLFRLP